MNKHLPIFLCFVFFFQFSNAQLLSPKQKSNSLADSLRGTLSPMRACYDVLMYDLDITIDIENKFISGSNTIKLIAVDDFQKLQIDLFENMKIEKIECNGNILSFKRLYNAVFIDFLDTVKKSTIRNLKIYYSGNPIIAKNPPWDGGFSWNKDKDGNPFVGVSCQGTGASLWWPCKDHQSDEPNQMLIRVSVPNDLVEVSNGRLKRKTDLENGFTKYEWYVSYPINNYDVTINIAKYKHFSDYYLNPNYNDTLSLDYYVLETNLEKAKKQFEQVKPMMEAYYNYFGEYPFISDGYKLVESTYLGMEHQSCVAYGNKFKNGYLGYDRAGTGYKFDYIIIHESAHEWWGNSITTNDIADMWIHEGFGTYAEALYVEYLYGYNAYLEYMEGQKKYVSNDSPIIGNFGINKEGSGDMYAKGALVIHTIRSIINNDKLFFEIIRGIQETYKYKCVDSKEIENYISTYSGINFNSFFDIYLRKKEVPTLNVSLYKDFLDLKAEYYFSFNNNAEGYYNNKPENSGFTMPLKITTEKNKFDFIFPTVGKVKAINLYDLRADDFKIATELFYINSKIIVE